ncbi:MAG: heme-binding domain-containing protein [Cyclobacteriaceae bacterium]|nr:heme-binding domain-containing protein [Cyclobacteriaceae bacterium]
MKRSRKIINGLIILIILMQVIQPTKNTAEGISENDISKTYAISTDVHQIFIEKCYDCHSHNTQYPWYNYIQPIGWWMAAHIHDGKEHLNFSEFKTYDPKKAAHKLEEISEAVNDGWMPLDSYTFLHQEARISANDREAINTWMKTLPITLEKK